MPPPTVHPFAKDDMFKSSFWATEKKVKRAWVENEEGQRATRTAVVEVETYAQSLVSMCAADYKKIGVQMKLFAPARGMSKHRFRRIVVCADLAWNTHELCFSWIPSLRMKFPSITVYRGKSPPVPSGPVPGG